MFSKRGSVAAVWFVVAFFMVGAGSAYASGDGSTSGNDPDRQPIVHLSGSGTSSDSNSELFTIGTLAAFAFVTAATALLTVRNHEDQ